MNSKTQETDKLTTCKVTLQVSSVQVVNMAERERDVLSNWAKVDGVEKEIALHYLHFCGFYFLLMFNF